MLFGGTVDFRCIAVDIANGPHHDLMRRQVRREINRLLCSGKLAAVPCTSFPIARKSDGKGPPSLRPVLRVFGRSEFSARDRENVSFGNALLDISIDNFEICWELAIFFF